MIIQDSPYLGTPTLEYNTSARPTYNPNYIATQRI